jgi:hypothetical protein
VTNETAPGIFSANYTGSGVAVALVIDVHPDGTQTVLNTAQFDSTQNRYLASPFNLASTDTYVLLL